MPNNNYITRAHTQPAGKPGNGLPGLKDYQHASKLYIDGSYFYSPKVGFLYYVNFNINKDAIRNENFKTNKQDVGLLVKKIDLPKFTIATETLNQYNRKTVVQSKITYNPVSIEFHDDNSDLTNMFWQQYYKYYFIDSVYGDLAKRGDHPKEFLDTKFDETNFSYGLDNYQSIPFLDSIDIFVLHQKKFTEIRLINPMITEWAHDSVSQAEGNKVLANKMTVAYESVLYESGDIEEGTYPEGFENPAVYDKSPSSLVLGSGNNPNANPAAVTGAGRPSRGDRVNGTFIGRRPAPTGGNLPQKNPFDIITTAIRGYNAVKNLRLIAKNTNLKKEGYNIAAGVLGSLIANGGRPGAINAAIQSGMQRSAWGGTLSKMGTNFGINLFSGANSSVNGSTSAKPASVTNKPKGLF